MKKIFSFCLIAILISACSGNTRPNPALLGLIGSVAPALNSVIQPAALPVIFSDEFNGSSLNLGKWSTQLPWGRTNPPELQYYSPTAFQSTGSNLRIVAKHEPMQGKAYTSGVITTFNSFQFTYGYVEARMRVPAGKGFWPALWLLDRSGTADEIDITEILGHEPNITYMTLHYETPGGGKGEVGESYTGPNFSTGYHTFAVDWCPSTIIWYVDGVERYRVAEHVPSKPMYLIANLAVGGNWPGNPDQNTPFPSYDDIDYIRVHRNECGPGPTATTLAATDVTASSATLNGIVNANNDSTTVTFEYGPTTAYGTSVTAVQSPIDGSSNISVNSQLIGLTSNTLYHFRAVAVNNFGAAYGSDQTFRTQDTAITIEIHNTAHIPITSAAVGDSLHSRATVTGHGPSVTGIVSFRMFNNPSCSGAGEDAGNVTLNSSGIAEPSSDALMTANGLSFKAHYSGDPYYLASDSLCASVSLSPYPTVLTLSANTIPQDGAIVISETALLNLQFNMDVRHGNLADSNSVDNPANYLLVMLGANNIFDTTSCSGGLRLDDIQVDVNFIEYDPATFIAKLTVNNGAALPNGFYRLFACGTTSISNPAGTTFLNNHLADSLVSFTVNVPEPTLKKKHKNLPDTGFAPNVATILPVQPADKAYTSEGMQLEIPTLNLKQPIVGVPENADWDVTWLGTSIGYLQGTAFPTWNGNSVLVGHATNANGKPGPFANLHSLRWGDKMVIHAWGQQYIYEVRSVNLWTDPDSTAVLTKHEDLSWLTLITCRGYDEKTNTYRWRSVVRGVLIQVK